MFVKFAILTALVACASAGVLNGLGGYAGGYAGGPAYGYAAASPVLAHAAPAIKIAAAPIIEAPQPYDFGYSHQTEDGAQAHRQESSDAHNNKQGSYGYTGPDGIYRQVDYVADAHGFRATIKTNEPGTAPQSPAATQLLAAEPPYKVLPAAAPIVKAAVHAPVYAAAATPVLKTAIPAYGHAYGAPLLRAQAYGAPGYGYHH